MTQETRTGFEQPNPNSMPTGVPISSLNHELKNTQTVGRKLKDEAQIMNNKLKNSNDVRLIDWVFHFVHAFRHEASKLEPYEKEWLKPYVKEQILPEPCQVEVLQISNSNCPILLFFFDNTKQDLLIKIHRKKLFAIDSIVKQLLDKYSTLNLNHYDFYRLVSNAIDNISDVRTRVNISGEINENYIYGINGINNVGCIYFTLDVLAKTSLLPWELGSYSNPQQTAQMVFSLNLDQASYC